MKNRNMTKVVLTLVVSIMFILTGVCDVFARGGSRGGGSRGGSSFRSSPSRSKSAPSKKSTWGTKKSTSSKATSPKKSTWGKKKPVTQKRTTTATKRTPTQKKSFEAASKNGTSKMTKAQSINKFKNDKAMQTKYKSSYASKPATRPSHIPASTKGANGVSHNVTYNVNHGGYGYMGASGSWMMYSAMSDAVMRSTLMTRNNCLYAGHPSVIGTHSPVIVHRSNSGFVLLMMIFGTIAVVVVGGIILKSLGII